MKFVKYVNKFKSNLHISAKNRPGATNTGDG